MSAPAFRNAKFEATGETKVVLGVTLHRIRAVAPIVALGVAAGALGGWIEKESNLSVYGDAWVYGNASVSGDAWVSGNASVCGNAWVYGDAWVYGNASVSGDARVCGDARVFDNARVCGDAQVYGDARVCGNAWVSGDARVSDVNLMVQRSDGYAFTLAPTPDGPRIIAGCHYFTEAEAKAHWGADDYRDAALGKESLLIVKALMALAKHRGLHKPVKECVV